MSASTPQRDSSGVRRCWLLQLGLVLLVLAAFSPAFGARFVNWDDHHNLDDLRRRGGVPWRFFAEPGSVDPYQPLAWVSLALDYQLWGLEPGLDAEQAGYFHASSVLIHALAALAFFHVARRVLELATDAIDARELDLAAALAAVAFAVHPLRAESVAWVTERRDVVSGLFFLLAALAWLRTEPSREDRVLRRAWAFGACAAAAATVVLVVASLDFERAPLRWRGLGPVGLTAALAALAASTFATVRATSPSRDRRRGAWFAACVALFALALASKGLTVVLPAVLLVLDAWPLRRLRGASLGAALLTKVPLVALALVGARFAMWAQALTGKTLYGWDQHQLGERVLQMFYGLWFYPSRTFVPLATSPSAFLPDDLRWSDARFFVPVVAVSALASAAIALRRKLPALLAAAVAFAVAVFPVLGLTQAGAQLVADRYSYLACMPFALLAAGAWSLARRRPELRVATSALALLAVAALAATTWARTRHWHDSESLWRHAIEVDASDGFAHTQLGSALVLRANDTADAAEERRLRAEANAIYEHAIAIDPTPLPGSFLNHGINLIALGRPAQAVPFLAGHAAEFPDDVIALTHLGAALAALARFDEARARLESAVAFDPECAKAWSYLARVRDELGDRPGAIEAYERLLVLWPKQAGARERLSALRSGG